MPTATLPRLASALLLSAIAAATAATAACDSTSDDRSAATPGTVTAADAAPTADTAAALGESAPPGPQDFRVLAGAKEGAVDVQWFMPEMVRVRAGDTVTWELTGYEGHTVTFVPQGRIGDLGPYFVPAADVPGAREFNPSYTLSSDAQGDFDRSVLINSGHLGIPGTDTYSLRFPQEGVYSCICMTHLLGMHGTVVVAPAGSDVPSPASVMADADATRREALDEAVRAQQAREGELRAQAAANGRLHPVAVGLDTDRSEVAAFIPASLTIDAGDTVVFTNSDRDFHNVIFAPTEEDAPQFPLLSAVPGRRGFRIVINPDAEREIAPPDGFGPGDLASSGMMGAVFARVQWPVTFTTPGRYRFVCTVHTIAGMSGLITVR